jgi:hypothetical protein
MAKKVLQIGYKSERDRLTWDGWDISLRPEPGCAASGSVRRRRLVSSLL